LKGTQIYIDVYNVTVAIDQFFTNNNNAI